MRTDLLTKPAETKYRARHPTSKIHANENTPIFFTPRDTAESPPPHAENREISPARPSAAICPKNRQKIREHKCKDFKERPFEPVQTLQNPAQIAVFRLSSI